jgi:hypothetical protein
LSQTRAPSVARLGKPISPWRGPFFAPPRGEKTHLYPHVCFACRSSFRRPVGRESFALICPRCRGPAVPLWTRFKPPPRDDAAQWNKVRALVRAGFFFLPVAERYPDALKEVEGFAARQGACAAEWRARWPDLYAALDEATAR